MSSEVVVRDILAVLPSGVMHADLEISGGIITGIVPAGQGGLADRVIEGARREAFPGLIDPHVHFRLDPAAAPGDSFDDMAEVATRGGVTSVVAFVTAPPEAVGVEAVRPFIDRAKSAPIDFGLHHVLWPRPANLRAISELVDAGVSSFKMFLAYPERGFMFEGALAVEALEQVARAGGLMLVHCEDGTAIRWFESRARRELGAAARIQDYLAARPEDLEAVSVAQVGLWAQITNCPLHLVHLSTAGGVEAAVRLRDRGQDVSLETCPHYLELDSADLLRLGPLAKFAPVLRPAHHRSALWSAVERGEISIIGTDHSGHAGEAKKQIAADRGIFEVPYGMPGLETLLPLLYTAGVMTGRLTLPQLAALLSTNSAKRFGWYPAKGAIQVGASADLTLVDPEDEREVSASRLRTNAGYSPYEGRRLRGWASATILHGEVVWDGKTVQAAPGGFLATGKGGGARRVPAGVH